MKNHLFHGSFTSGIETLHATSKLHGTFEPVWRMAQERAGTEGE